MKPKEKVLIQGHDVAHPLVNEIYKECLLSNADPLVLPLADVDYTFHKYAKKHQLRQDFTRSVLKFLFKKIDVQITVLCNPNPKHLTGVDAAKIAMNRASRRDLMDLLLKREGVGEFRWTALPYPISADAQEASMALQEYEDFVYRSCLVDKEDPVKEWKEIYASQERICKYLNDVARAVMTERCLDGMTVSFGHFA